MDEDLKHLKESLKRLDCPPAVMARVRERIACDARTLRARHRNRLAVAVLACTATIIGALVLIQPAAPPVEVATAPKISDAERLAVVQEARLTFAVFGDALQTAFDRTEPILLKQAVEPLQNNLLTIKNKLAPNL